MPFTSALVAAGLGGFVALSYVLLWYRAFSFASGGAAATFPLLIAAYLIGVAKAGLVARLVRERFDDSRSTARAVAVLSVGATAVAFVSVPIVSRIAEFANWGWGLPVVALSAAMLGAIAPLVGGLVTSADQADATSRWYVYAGSIFGSAFGALGTGFILMRFLDTAAITSVLAVIGALIAAVVVSSSVRDRERRVWFGATAAVAICAVGFGRPIHSGAYERLLYKSRYHGQRFEHLIERRTGVVALTPDHHVFGGGIYDGTAKIDLEADQNHLIRAFAIPALHASPKRVLIVGLASGAWAQVIANLPSVEDVTVVDGDPSYRELIPFNPDVASLARNPKVHIVADDPRRWLARNSNERFDIIVSNTTFNWRASASRLLSVEFMGLVRDRLAPRGIFYFNTTDVPEAFWSAFAVFAHGARFQNFAAVSMSPVGFDMDRWRRTLVQYRLDGVALFDSTTDVGRKRLATFLATPRDRSGWYGAPMVESRTAMLQRLHGGTPITDDNMGTEWRSVYPTLFVP